MSRLSTKQRRARTERRRVERIYRYADQADRDPRLGANSMVRHYDEYGRPCSFGQWVRLMEIDPQRRRLARTQLPNGYLVSTVALGLDHAFGGGRPLLFETMVFRGKSGSGLDQYRWHTRQEALAGHGEVVKAWARRPRLRPVKGD